MRGVQTRIFHSFSIISSFICSLIEYINDAFVVAFLTWESFLMLLIDQSYSRVSLATISWCVCCAIELFDDSVRYVLCHCTRLELALQEAFGALVQQEDNEPVHIIAENMCVDCVGVISVLFFYVPSIVYLLFIIMEMLPLCNQINTRLITFVIVLIGCSYHPFLHFFLDLLHT